MISQLVELKLSAASKRRLLTIAEAGVLGRTVDDIVSHFVREALHRDWLEQEVIRDRAPMPAAPTPRPAESLRIAEVVSETPPRTEKRLIRMPEVCNRIGVSRSSLYKMIGSGDFPAPKNLGARTIAWLESEVSDWIDSKSSAH